MEKKSTITIRSWMLTRLHLDNWTLLVYAIIYQTRKKKPEGWTKTEMSRWLDYNSGSTWRILNFLEKHYLLEHTPNGRYLCRPLPRVRKSQEMTDEQLSQWTYDKLKELYSNKK